MDYTVGINCTRWMITLMATTKSRLQGTIASAALYNTEVDSDLSLIVNTCGEVDLAVAFGAVVLGPAILATLHAG